MECLLLFFLTLPLMLVIVLFYSCRKLENVYFSEKWTSLDSEIFEWYDVIHTINLPVNLSYINNRCFFEYYKLNSIKMLKNWLKSETGLHVIVHHWIRLVRLQIWQKFLIFYLFFLFKFEIGCFWRTKLFKNLRINFLKNSFQSKIIIHYQLFTCIYIYIY